MKWYRIFMDFLKIRFVLMNKNTVVDFCCNLYFQSRKQYKNARTKARAFTF